MGTRTFTMFLSEAARGAATRRIFLLTAASLAIAGNLVLSGCGTAMTAPGR